MNCSEVIERLPWLLNGTLADGERAIVKEHLAGCADCRAELEQTTEAWRLFATHPPAEMLVDFALGRPVTGASRALLETHLGHCETCRDESALVRSEPSLLEERRRSKVYPIERSSLRWLAAAAAIVALVTTGTLLVRRPQSPQPQANVALVELLSESLRLRGDGEPIAIDATRPVTLILATDRILPVIELRVRILEPNGAAVWESALAPGANGQFTLHLPAHSVPAGDLALALEAREAGGWAPVERYELEVNR